MIINKPLVSVITIFLNAGKPFFEEAIASIFAQTYNNWELLLVDDGSTDISTAIAQQYAHQYPDRVRYLEHEGHQNQGMSASRNLGIQHAKGEYIALLDADDVWLPEKLEKQVTILDSMPEVGMVCGPTQYWYSWTGNAEDAQRDCLREIGVQSGLYTPPTLLKLLLKDEVRAPATCSFLMRRDLVKLLGGFEASFRSMFEDRAFFAKVYLDIPVFVMSQYLDRYRQHPDSTCAVSHNAGTYSPTSISPSHLNYLTWLSKYLVQQDIKDREIWHSLRQNLLLYRPFLLRLYKSAKYVQRQILRVKEQLREQGMLLMLSLKTSHVFGIKKIDYAVDELIVLCVVRNGKYYVESFIDHHTSLGVKHIIFLDNGSTDETIAIAQRYPNVTILQTKCPYQKYETVMKKYLAKRFSKHRWNLFADIDELFDYPSSDVMSLSSLLTYLNQNSYTAVVSQMLDLFSEHPLNQIESNEENSIKDTSIYYDISNIQITDYQHDIPPNPDIKKHFGGIRKSIFGTNNGLTKAALTFVDHKIKLFVDFHHTKNARIADFTCVLLHYPFSGQFYEKVLDAVQADRYQLSASHEYEKYWQRLQQDPNLRLKTATARQLKSINSLLNSNFLVASENYLQWTKTHADLHNESNSVAFLNSREIQS